MAKYDVCECGNRKTAVSKFCIKCRKGSNNQNWRGGESASRQRYHLSDNYLKICPSCSGYKTRNAKQCNDCKIKYQKGENHHRYIGRSITSGGYVTILKHGHPNAQKSGRIMEHVYVMSEHFGRPLFKDENVHHKNGDKQDNRLENLELWSVSQPPGQRVEDKIKWAKEILERYGYDSNRGF